MRRIIYTTNSIESLNFQLRKIIKNRGHFPSDDAVIKLLWLAIRDIEDKQARQRARPRSLPLRRAIRRHTDTGAAAPIRRLFVCRVMRLTTNPTTAAPLLTNSALIGGIAVAAVATSWSRPWAVPPQLGQPPRSQRASARRRSCGHPHLYSASSSKVPTFFLLNEVSGSRGVSPDCQWQVIHFGPRP